MILARIKNLLVRRHLLLYLAIRELKIRYKYPFLGFLWMLLVPLCMALIFKLVFSIIIKVPIPNYPFFVFLFTAIFAWNYFALTLSGATTSLVDNSNLIKKVYFPREIIPISILVGNLINFAITTLLILILLILFRVGISGYIIFLPFVIILQSLFMVGLVLVSSSLQVCFRDVKYMMEILLLAWFYLTPIFYPLSLVAKISPEFFGLYMLNPLACLITIYRIVFLKNFLSFLPKGLNLSYLVVYTILICLVTFFLGFWIFRRYDSRISDYL